MTRVRGGSGGERHGLVMAQRRTASFEGNPEVKVKTLGVSVLVSISHNSEVHKRHTVRYMVMPQTMVYV